ncbi:MULTISPECIES: hypothetical protein [Alteromonadaceae]|uniref:hypothetical protein n=1 Tax=Alteromonadaceae TaxID=72275 RepID=UPI001C0A226B|nr:MULTISPECIES: hypothetical protein [Aliiglaciecola]MBU2879071.1 hypothetical protein [Aliiglaciecola lipolytica]MDO6710769.1 hypothetical protein [Aliiglaciecola sp. 2_MG-2023]MDO6751823.1 hypothetical protein [Aliiglaciecola sp. 1_MG-2023]
MTRELINLHDSICESTRSEIQQQRIEQKNKDRAVRDQQFDSLIRRLDNLRMLAKSKNKNHSTERRIQTSFAF